MSAIASTPDNRFTIKSWGDALYEQAKRKFGEERDRLITLASEKYGSIGNHQALLKLSISLGEQVKDVTFNLPYNIRPN